MKNLGAFNFYPDDVTPPEHVRYLVRITRGISDKQALLRLISAALQFPEYFGFNWDALDECLADLSWLEPGDIVIWHESMPLSHAPKELSHYLNVLRNTQQDLSRSITVSFPESSRDTVERMLS